MPRKQSINGEREITLSFLRGDINDKFIADIETGWTANFKGDKYHLFNEREDQHGNKEFDAVLDFFHHFNGRWHMDDVDDKSMTIDDSIRPLFDDSPYVLSIIDNFYANTMNYSKQQNSTERFLYFIGRHNAEFNIPIGTQTVQVRNKIGVQRNDVFIHEDDNLVDFNITTDTGSFCTTIEYYYDFKKVDGGDSEKKPTKKDVYRSPMADKYGEQPGEPIYDERFSIKENARLAAKQKQESTWKSSFEIAAERFDTPLNIGDEVRFIVPSKSINGYIRVVEINEQFDEDGELIEATYTFGNENIANQYRKMQYDSIQDISDIMLGKKPIPYNVLPRAMKQAVDIVLGDTDSVMDYRRDRMTGHNSKNEGNNITVNSSGLVLHHNFEPMTAITHLGIVATAITAGTIDTNRVLIQGSEGHFWMDGDKLKAVDYNNPDRYFEITPQGAHAHKGMLKITRPDGHVIMNNGVPTWSFSGQLVGPNLMVQGVSVSGQYYSTSNTTDSTMEAWYFVHDTQYLNLRGYARMYFPKTNSSSGVVILRGFGNLTAEAYQFIPNTKKDSNNQTEQVYVNITLDLGVPDGRLKSLYIQGRSGNSQSYLRFRRLILNWYG